MTLNQVTINQEQELYVIPEGSGYSCLGFDVCKERTEKYAKWLGAELAVMPVGCIEAYELYRSLSEQIRQTGRRCDVELCPQLIGLEGRRVEVVDKYGDTRRFWVGKSTGWLPVHLEISRKTSHGGPAVMGAPFKSVRVIGRSR